MNDHLDPDFDSEDDKRAWYENVRSCLEENVSVAEVEVANMYEGRPFGYLDAVWGNLKARMIDGDELWCDSSPGETWEALCGRAGYALVRNGEVIDDILIMMN